MYTYINIQYFVYIVGCIFDRDRFVLFLKCWLRLLQILIFLLILLYFTFFNLIILFTLLLFLLYFKF